MARSIAASLPSGGGGTLGSQAMLTKTLRPVGTLIVAGEGTDWAEEVETRQETSLSAVDLMQKPGEGERETRAVVVMGAMGAVTGREAAERESCVRPVSWTVADSLGRVRARVRVRARGLVACLSPSEGGSGSERGGESGSKRGSPNPSRSQNGRRARRHPEFHLDRNRVGVSKPI